LLDGWRRDSLDGAESFPKRSKRSDGLPIPSVGPPPLGLAETVDFCLQRAILFISGAPESSHDLGRSPLADGTGGKHRRVASERDYLAPDPFEVFTALIGIRQHVDGVSGRHGADLLKTPPRLHAGIG